MDRGTLLSKEIFQGWWTVSFLFVWICLKGSPGAVCVFMHMCVLFSLHNSSLVPLHGAQERRASLPLPCSILSTQPPVTLQALHKIYRHTETRLNRERVLCWSLKVIWYGSAGYKTPHQRENEDFLKTLYFSSIRCYGAWSGIKFRCLCCSLRLSQLRIIPHERPLDILYSE